MNAKKFNEYRRMIVENTEVVENSFERDLRQFYLRNIT